VAKPPSWNEIRTSAAAFAARWADETNEKAEAQTFWNEFLGISGIDRCRVAVFLNLKRYAVCQGIITEGFIRHY